MDAITAAHREVLVERMNQHKAAANRSWIAWKDQHQEGVPSRAVDHLLQMSVDFADWAEMDAADIAALDAAEIAAIRALLEV